MDIAETEDNIDVRVKYNLEVNYEHLADCSITMNIKSRESVLSPRTIMDYKRIRTHDIQSLMAIQLNRLTQQDIQNAINLESARLSPKSVRNTHGLISAVLRQYKPSMRLTTALPQKVRPELYIPTDDEIKTLMEYVAGTDLELPVLLAAFGLCVEGRSALLTLTILRGTEFMCAKIWYELQKIPGS